MAAFVSMLSQPLAPSPPLCIFRSPSPLSSSSTNVAMFHARISAVLNNPNQHRYNVRIPVAANHATAASPFSALELTESQIVIHEQSLTIIQPKDVDEVIDMYITQGRLDRDPYWCRLWPSAIALAEEILAHPELVRGLDVCDLGAGLGLAGLAAVMAGARQVVLFDREVKALLCALLSVHVNIPGVATNLGLIMHTVTQEELSSCLPGPALPAIPPTSVLGKAAEIIPSLSRYLMESQFEGLFDEGNSTLTVRAELLDWTDKGLHHRDFDVVLACDVLYEKPAVELIADLVPRLLRPRACTKLLVADPVERNPKNRDKFLELFQSRNGMQGMVLERRELRTPEMDGSTHQVELLHLKSR